LIRIGSAGWSYPDWSGVVYPAGSPRGFDPLAFLASFVDCIEVNSTFYRIPDPAAAESWAKRVPDPERFRFTAKLWRGFTHEGEAMSASEATSSEAAFRVAMGPLKAAGLLGAVLVQFPYSFHDTPVSRKRLAEILDRFADLPLVVEVRHSSWLKDEVFAWLRERGAGFCNVDQPEISANIPPTAHVTSPVGYVRFHGRNRETWFAQEPGADRYNYLYSAEELAPWADRIRSVAASADDVFVIANNHYGGKAVANALELKSMIEGREVEAPGVLLRAFPTLAAHARPAGDPVSDPLPEQGDLPFQ
jgi:uncharacterized protein YecE (DUF72 family)